MMRWRVASSIVGVVGGKVKTFSDARVGDGLLERSCWRRRNLACGERYGGASIPWRRSERRWSASDAGVGVVASDAAADSSGGTAAASEGLDTFHVGNQDMWEGSAGGKKDQAESLRTDHAMIELISAYNPSHLMVHWVVPPHLLSLVLLRNLLRRGATVACVGRTSRLLRVVDAV